MQHFLSASTLRWVSTTPQGVRFDVVSGTGLSCQARFCAKRWESSVTENRRDDMILTAGVASCQYPGGLYALQGSKIDPLSPKRDERVPGLQPRVYLL